MMVRTSWTEPARCCRERRWLMMMVWMKKTATRHDATDDVYQFCFLFFLLDVHFFSLWQEKIQQSVSSEI
jgi:hypothetical protein